MSRRETNTLRHQRALVEFGEFALRSNGLVDILQESCRLVGAALGTGLAKVMELQADGVTLLMRAGFGWHPDLINQVSVEASITSSEGYALLTGRPAISPDVNREKRFRYAPFVLEEGVKGMMAVVIIGHDTEKPYGVLQVDSRQSQYFKKNDVVFLQGYANLIGAAVDRLRAVGEARVATEHVHHMAYHDALTGLSNRALFLETLQGLLSSCDKDNPVAVLFLDLDGFKQVNDYYGHLVGDDLLVQVAGRLSRAIRKVDLVARLGGDEFAIIQTEPGHRNNAGQLACRLSKALAEPYLIGEREIIIGGSVGIAFEESAGESAEAVLAHADQALYLVKIQGKGTYQFYDPSVSHLLKEKQRLTDDLRHAISHRQFELHYQPILRLTDDRIICFEALLRWHHPDRGLVLPGDFIELAEETGLIVPIGKWVLRSACHEAVRWQDDIRVAVNLSPRQLGDASLITDIADILAESGLAAHRLELEITESFALQQSGSAISVVTALKKLGVQIALDDFGTGYSSFSHLRQLPFDNIKLDRSFVEGLPDHGGADAIVRAVSHLGTSFRAVTTAEGVETKDQLDFVRREGFGQIQGYLVSRPVPAFLVPEMIAREATGHKLSPQKCNLVRIA